MILGLTAGIGAGALWGFVFIAPLLLPDHSLIELTIGRYLIFGLCSLLLLIGQRCLRSFPRHLWYKAFLLTILGNVGYFYLLVAAIRLADGLIPTLVIGMIPISMPLIGLLRSDPKAIRIMLLPFFLILLGFALAHSGEFKDLPNILRSDHILGLACSVGAMLAWTAYGVINSDIIKRYNLNVAHWASLTGVATLPVLLLMLILLMILPNQSAAWSFSWSAFADTNFLIIIIFTGLFSSWVAGWLWNLACKILPLQISGQLIVFETIAGLAYIYMLRQSWPEFLTFLGIVMLFSGVVLGVRHLYGRPLPAS